MADKPNVVQIISRMNTGGVELSMLRFSIRNTDRLGEVHFWLVGQSDGEREMEEYAQKSGILLHKSPRSAKGLREFKKFLRTHKIDVVHAHIGFPSALYLRVARKCHVPVRIGHWRSIQVSSGSILKDRLIKRLQKVMANSATHVWTISEAVRKSLSYPGLRKKAQVVYNGYSLSEPGDKGPDSPLNLLHVGRFHPLKNHRMIWEILGQMDRSFRFVACGRHDHVNGLPDKAWVEQMQNKWGDPSETPPQEVISLPGNCSDIPGRLTWAHAFIFPSIHEGLAGALIEAASQGCICFASDIPAHREVAAHFSNIKLISLQKPAAEWATSICGHSYDIDPGKAYREFLDSPFTYTRMDKAYLDAYYRKKR